MKTNLICVILCLCVLLTIPFGAQADNPGEMGNPTGSTVATESTSQDTTTPEQPTVVKQDITYCTVSLAKSSYTYNGAERKPSVTVSSGDVVFKKGKDYTVSYENNVNAGTAKVFVSAIESEESLLKGKVTKYFRIDKKTLASFKNKTISQSEFVYDGAVKKPTLSFVGDDTTAVLGTDYTVSYQDNKAIGIATVTATGKGNFKGTYSKTFKICPQKVTDVKASKIKDTTFKLSWSSVSGKIDGYRIYRYNSKTKVYDYAVSTSNTYFEVGGRTPATVYNYIVRAYKKDGDKVVLGVSSDAKSVVMKPKKVVVASSAYSGKNFVFKWKKCKSDGYEIRYSKDKNLKKGVKVKTVASGKTTSLKVKLSKKINYYYQVRSFKTINGKKLYGAWSIKKTTKFSNVYAKYSTTFYSPAGRTTNIKVACKYIDGTVLQPGEVFSFNKVVGQRTPERGFKLATVYSGQETKEGYGGGVCQVSTTIFNAALYGDLGIVERYQHSMTVHYVPYGRDAAISWGSADFKFKNTTDEEIKISAKVYNDSKIEVQLLTNSKAKPKKVTLNVSSSSYDKGRNRYVLTRTVDKKVNYSTSSIY